MRSEKSRAKRTDRRFRRIDCEMALDRLEARAQRRPKLNSLAFEIWKQGSGYET